MISRYSAHGLTWVDLESPTPEETAHIVEEFGIPQLVGQEMIENTIRSKVDLYPECLYLVLHFPIISHSLNEAIEQEIDFIIGKKFLITVRYESIEAITTFAKIFETNSLGDHPSMATHGGFIFMQMIKEFYKKSLHQLESMTGILKQIEHRIFSNQKTSIVRDISQTSRKLLDFRQAIRFHGEILSSYESASKRLFGEEYGFYAETITSEYKKVNNILESHRDVLSELQRTNDSLLSSKSNEIMRNFTIMTFVMLPLTLITGIFGMNTVNDLIFIRSIGDFYFIVGVMLITGAVMFLFFKLRRWL
jgi:magnesium transporter